MFSDPAVSRVARFEKADEEIPVCLIGLHRPSETYYDDADAHGMQFNLSRFDFDADGGSDRCIDFLDRADGCSWHAAARVAPDPTMAESGLPGFDVAPWRGLFLHIKTTPAVVARLHSDTIGVLAEPAIQKRMQDLGYTSRFHA
jgi:hypothetical protein